MRKVVKKEYVDSRTIFKSVGDLGVGTYLYKEIIGANVLIISFRNSDNSTDVITFITSSYAISIAGCVVTVNLLTGMIKIDALASTFKFNSFIVLK